MLLKSILKMFQVAFNYDSDFLAKVFFKKPVLFL